MENKLSVSEVFLSIQGEGMSMGKRSVFLRLAGCNLMCGGQGTQFDHQLHNGAQWRCDTIEVWMKGASKKFDQILDDDMMVALLDGAHLVITGGEPLLQQDAICEFLDALDLDIYVEVETNGTIMPTAAMIERVSQWNISPKLSSSGNGKHGINHEVLNFFNESMMNSVQFKFVVATGDDLDEIKQLELDPQKIWLMPAGSNQQDIDQRSQSVAAMAILERYSYSHRLQIAIWNLATGV